LHVIAELRVTLIAIITLAFVLVISSLSGCVMGAHASRPDISDVDAFYNLPAALDTNGDAYDFSQTKGKVVLVVNVASLCGLTTVNYADLKSLQDEFGDDLLIMAFPCNAFLFQEPFGARKTCAFARKRGFTGVVMAKVSVNGCATSHVFKHLKRETNTRRIGWNFGKFLVGKDGKVRGFYTPHTRPVTMKEQITKLIAE